MRTSKILILFVVYLIGFNGYGWPNSEENTLVLEVSDQGYLFTDITIADKKVKAMIDFGDPNQIQLSERLVKALELPLEATGKRMAHVNGESWELFKGTIKKLTVGSWIFNKVQFYNPQDEIEQVSSMVNVDFNAILGWKFFEPYVTHLDYNARRIKLFKRLPAQNLPELWLDYNKDYSYLVISLKYGDTFQKFILDTASPISVIDQKLFKTSPNRVITLNKTKVNLEFYPQDLSILKDLKVVGILGADFLKQYGLLIDPKFKRIGLYQLKN